jgi:ABC-2 type transport system permease protein
MRRAWAVARLELTEAATRPLYLLWALFLGYNAYLMSRASWIYRSIDTSVGTQVSWVNSEFQIAFVFALIVFLMIAFLVALAAGMPSVRDSSTRVDELLHATPLSVREYVWGRFLGSLLGILAVLAFFAVSLLFFNHVLPDSGVPESYGPLRLGSVVRPALVFLVPPTVLLAGLAFLIGVATRRPILVFLLPVAAMLFYNQFYWGWVPPEMDPQLRTVLQWLDPSGFRWLKQNWLMTDRGIAFYNQNPIGYDAAFLASRAAFVALGLAMVPLAGAILRRRLRGESRRPVASLETAIAAGVAARPAVPATWKPEPSLAVLGMGSKAVGWARGALTVARFELTELIFQPALYLLLPLVFLISMVLIEGAGQGNVAAVASGVAFGQPTLITPGIAAVLGYQHLLFWGTVLILFYTIEALRREETTGVAPIYLATPMPSAAVLIGKALAICGVMAAIAAAVFLAAFLNLSVPFEAKPFLILWGAIFTPTFLVWLAFLVCVHSLTGSRVAAYGAAVVALVANVLLGSYGYATWLTDWMASAIVSWSDLSVFELDRRVLVLNRLFALSLALCFGWLALRFHRRQEGDATHRSRRRLSPWTALLALPIGLGFLVWQEVHAGFQGDPLRQRHEDYWRMNLATFREAALPEIDHAELAIDLEPSERRFDVDGFYTLTNRTGAPLPWIPVTGGSFWTGLQWTLDGAAAQPEDRRGLYLFRLPAPLAEGGTVKLGFRYQGQLPKGSTRNGGVGGTAEFMLPAGVVVTGRNPEFVPVVGYDRTRGIDEDNRYEPAIFPAEAHVGKTRGDNDRSPFTHRLAISAPAEYTVNSTGALTGVEESKGRKTWRWETDYPVRVFNIIAGRYERRAGEGTAIFYDRRHTANVETMAEALDGARKYFSEWYFPYPWRELRLSEFPGLASYARGNATNIFFSESVGFLGAQDGFVDSPFAIAAHEAAHSWWGHLVSHGEAPGGIVLSEGGANFATLMLLEQLRGTAQRERFARAMEASFGEGRQPTSEKPLVETFSHRPGDTTVIYDKGGWVLWMLMEHMGREAFLQGVQAFFRAYHNQPDHPVLQDLIATLRPFAADAAAYDAFCRQWFFTLEVPEYRIATVSKRALGDPAGAYLVAADVLNAGGTTMPVEVAAVRGFRGEDGYQECRGQLTLSPAQTRKVELRCPFEPERLILDPDVKVLQLQRQAARVKIPATP